MAEQKLNFLEKWVLGLLEKKALKKGLSPEALKEFYLKDRQTRFYRSMNKLSRLSPRLRKDINKFYDLFPQPKQRKNVLELNDQEFYDYLRGQDNLQGAFLDFLMDYISIAYLENDISTKDIDYILKMTNAFDIKNYLDQKVNEIKYRYTLAQEIMNYSRNKNGNEISQLVSPDETTDKLQTVEQLKQNLERSMPSMEQMKKDLAKVQMIKAEQERISKQRKRIVTNAPEALELTKIPDRYASELQKQQEHQQAVQKESAQEERKKVILRKAPVPLTPSEMIAEKKKLLEKTKRRKGLDIKT
jgi:hypothetical protein